MTGNTRKISTSIGALVSVGYDNRARIFWLLAFTSLFALGTYIFAVHTTARNLANSQELKRQITSVSSELDALEFNYIGFRNSLTLETAYQYGLREARNPVYVSRTAGRTSLSLNTPSNR